MAVDTIIGQRLSVRETENLVKNLKNKLPPKVALKLDKRYLEKLSNLKEIFSKFDVPVKIKGKKITIEFDDIADIDRMISKIK